MHATLTAGDGDAMSALTAGAAISRTSTRASPFEASTSIPRQHILILDCDEDVRTTLRDLFLSVGMCAIGFASTHDLLDADDLRRAGCIVAEVRLPGSSGLQLQAALAIRGEAPPIIFLTGHGDIQMAVAAIKAGAVDFLTKPVRDQTLLDAVNLALDIDARRRQEAQLLEVHRERLASLTKREAQVFREVVRGRLNKQIAFDLGISEVTVKLHRCNVMRKMHAASIVELIRTWEVLRTAMRDEHSALPYAQIPLCLSTSGHEQPQL